MRPLSATVESVRTAFPARWLVLVVLFGGLSIVGGWFLPWNSYRGPDLALTLYPRGSAGWLLLPLLGLVLVLVAVSALQRGAISAWRATLVILVSLAAWWGAGTGMHIDIDVNPALEVSRTTEIGLWLTYTGTWAGLAAGVGVLLLEVGGLLSKGRHPGGGI